MDHMVAANCHTNLCGHETWMTSVKEKSRVKAAESKSVSLHTKCAFQNCRKNKGILHEWKIELFCQDTIENG
jgi:hypothetical protein